MATNSGRTRLPDKWGRRVHGVFGRCRQSTRTLPDRRIPPGTYTATFTRAGSATSALLVTITSGLVTEQDVVLAPQASISGQILEDGIARAGSVVRLYKIEEFDTTVLAEVTTGANGRYTFAGLEAPQDYVVAVALAPGSSTLIASRS